MIFIITEALETTKLCSPSARLTPDYQRREGVWVTNSQEETEEQFIMVR